MSPDNQQIIANAQAAYRNGKITREQRNEAIRLAYQNEIEAKMLKKYELKNRSHDLESRSNGNP